jgi:hypothetical protein
MGTVIDMRHFFETARQINAESREIQVPWAIRATIRARDLLFVRIIPYICMV